MTGPGNSPTPTRGVVIQLDKERHLRFSLKTMRELREAFGDDALEKGVGTDAIAQLLWYGLRWEDPGLTVEDVEDLVDLENLEDMMLAVAKATGNRAAITEEQVRAGFTKPAVAGTEPPEKTTEEHQESEPTNET